MMKRNMVTLLALGLFSVGAVAAAPAFEDLDANQDGVISADEATVVEGLDIASADTDGDGVLSREEYAAATESM
jgi:hypothetical protein